MIFNTFVILNLYPILEKYGYGIAEESENIVSFQSSLMKLNLSYNRNDRTFLVEIGKIDNTLYPLNDGAIKELLGLELAIEEVPLERFTKNLVIFFQTSEGIDILNGRTQKLIKIISHQSERYTSQLLQKQALEMASIAWNMNDYLTFIKAIDIIGTSKISKSYLLKYKIAKQKL